MSNRLPLDEADPSSDRRRGHMLGANSACDTEKYLGDCRELVLAEIRRHVPRDTRHAAGLYDVMLDYPLRPAKALRPALCLSVCRALGGQLDAALPSAAALELFHNAFLVHDDVEDASLRRRHGPALHVEHGVPIAINVGDALLATALQPLLDNIRVVGLGPALRILSAFAQMARESVEGQMLELSWIRQRRWSITDRDYVRMVHKKTGWYSFIAPVQVGAIVAGADQQTTRSLARFALLLGIAFQIRDDLLSLESEEADIGKDALGDLWEGKYTLPLLHALRTLAPAERHEALAILDCQQPAPSERTDTGTREAREALFEKIDRHGSLLAADERALLKRSLIGEGPPLKTQQSVRRLHALVTGRGGVSLTHARRMATRYGRRAARMLERDLARIPESTHRAFLIRLVSFVTQRIS